MLLILLVTSYVTTCLSFFIYCLPHHLFYLDMCDVTIDVTPIVGIIKSSRSSFGRREPAHRCNNCRERSRPGSTYMTVCLHDACVKKFAHRNHGTGDGSTTDIPRKEGREWVGAHHSRTSRAMHTINDGRCIDDGNIWPYIRITEQGAGRWIDLSCIDRPFMSCMEQFRFHSML